MQKNSQEFSMQEAVRLSKTPAGQQLLATLQQADPALLQKIAQQASSGDYTTAAQQLSALLKQLEG